MDRRHAQMTVAALIATALAIAGCGGGATFSPSGFDAVEVGDSADTVTEAIGEPAAKQELMTESGDGGESAAWVYCDGSRPYYLIVTDGKVADDDFHLPDEIRLNVESC